MISKVRSKILAKAFVENDLNGVKTVKAVDKENAPKSETSIRVKASRMLNSTNFQRALSDVLNEMGMDNYRIQELLKRNAEQNKNLAASNTAIDMAIKVKGEYAPEKRLTLNADIRTEEDADKALDEIMNELKEIKEAIRPAPEA